MSVAIVIATQFGVRFATLASFPLPVFGSLHAGRHLTYCKAIKSGGGEGLVTAKRPGLFQPSINSVADGNFVF